MYISKVRLDTQDSDIKRYMEAKNKENVNLGKIIMKREIFKYNIYLNIIIIYINLLYNKQMITLQTNQFII